MKKIKFLVIALSLVIAATLLFTFSSKGGSTLGKANIEALADSFTFGGQEWNDDYHWYNEVGNLWKPSITPCIGVSQDMYEVGLGYVGFTVKVIQHAGPTTIFFGRFVACIGGTGNCFNGTDCLAE